MKATRTIALTTINRSRTKFVYVAAIIFAALGGLLFGYNTGVIAGALMFIKRDFALTTLTEEMIVSSIIFGALMGTIIGGKASDRFGRRTVLFITAPIFIIGALGCALAPSAAVLIVSRAILGLPIGLSSATVPVYLSEIAPRRARGCVVSLFQLSITIGIFSSYLIGYALAASHGWRWMLGLSIAPALAFGAGVFFLPESPRWLVSHDRYEIARDVLTALRGGADSSGEIAEIQASLAQQSHGGRWVDLRNLQVRVALVVGMGLAVFQQITGINTVIYYGPSIFQSAGFTSASGTMLATIGIGVVNVLMTIVAMYLVDRVGRRPLLLFGLASMFISLGVLALAFRISTPEGYLAWIAVGCLIVYVASFAISLGPIFWLLISEIYPLKIRGLAESMAAAVIWGSDLIVTLTFLTLIEKLGTSRTLLLYAFFSGVAWLFVYYHVPETKGRTLEEIEAFWRERVLRAQ